jgi:hypothetical protein
MRRSRKRRRAGLACYRVRDTEVEALVQLGLLPSGERTSRQSVVRALHLFFDETLSKVVA